MVSRLFCLIYKILCCLCNSSIIIITINPYVEASVTYLTYKKKKMKNSDQTIWRRKPINFVSHVLQCYRKFFEVLKYLFLLKIQSICQCIDKWFICVSIFFSNIENTIDIVSSFSVV